MNFELSTLKVIAPEIFVLAMACVVLMVDLFRVKFKVASASITYFLTQLTVLGAGYLTFNLYQQVASAAPQVFFSGAFILDNVGNLLKIFLYITTFLAFLCSYDYIKARRIQIGEYYVLGLFVLLGMMVLVSAYNFLSLFLGLELLSLPLYAMVALRRDSATAAEGAMKYFVMGSLASGMLLYGISFIYGATQSIDIARIAEIIQQVDSAQRTTLVFGLVFLVVGFTFKLGAAPFHMWVPDVYEGAPSSVTLFLGSAPKIAAFGMAIRILVDAMPALQVQWQPLLIAVAVISIALGNLIAIVQTNLKRLLAYSAIAHMGYMALGLLTGTEQGYAAAMFYIITYALMSTGAFAVLILLSQAGFEAENISDFRGLNQRHPWFAFMMLLVMFSMAGIPPAIGFFAKLGVLEAIVATNYIWLAVYAMVFSIIGSYYYIAVVKAMYFEDAPAQNLQPLAPSPQLYIAVSVNGLLMLMLGLFPNALLTWCRAVF